MAAKLAKAERVIQQGMERLVNEEEREEPDWIAGLLDLGQSLRVQIQVAAIGGPVRSDPLRAADPVEENQLLESQRELRTDATKRLGECV